MIGLHQSNRHGVEASFEFHRRTQEFLRNSFEGRDPSMGWLEYAFRPPNHRRRSNRSQKHFRIVFSFRFAFAHRVSHDKTFKGRSTATVCIIFYFVMNLTRIVSIYLALVLVLTPCVLGCGEDPVTSGGCRCTSSTNVTGITVPYAGCDNHIGDSCFCYVKNPNNCNDGDLGPNTS